MHSFIIDLFGPIFAKELVEMARRWRYYMNRIILGVVVLFVLFVAYENNRHRYNMTTATMVPIGMSKMAEVFFNSYLWVQFLSVFLFVPFFLTGVISGEREQKTLDLLFTTQLRDREIIFGKLGSRVVSMLMLILSGVPIIAITMLMGGVNPQTLWQGMIATMNALLFTSAVAIYMSATTRSTIGALVRTYWWLIVTIVLVPLGIMLTSVVCVYINMYSQGLLITSNYVSNLRHEYQQIASTTFAVLNPVTAFAVAVDPSLGRQFSIIIGPWYFYLFLIIPTLFSCLLIFFAIRAVRREATESKWTARLRWVIQGIVSLVLLKPVTRRLFHKLPQARADTVWGMTVSNPLWLRSRMAFVYDRENHIQRFQLAGWILFVLIFGLILFNDPAFITGHDAPIGFLGWIWFGIGILACLVSGYSIAGDKRKGFFEFVLVTPLVPSEVILGTFLAVWRHIRLSYSLAIVVTAIFMTFGDLPLVNGLVSILIGTLFISLLILFGIVASLVSKSIPTGLIATFAFPVITLLCVPMFGSMFRNKTIGALWLFCFITLPPSTLLLIYRKNLFTVSSFFIWLHVCITVLATFWIFSHKPYLDSTPLMVINGGMQTLAPLDASTYSPFSQSREEWQQSQFMFVLALVANVAFLFWWTCRNYDVLTGRRSRRRQQNPQTIPLSH